LKGINPLDAEVYWDGRQVGVLRGVTVDQPYYLGEWCPFDNLEFATQLAAQRWLPVVFRSKDGATTAPARALLSSTPGVGVYFRFG
jgi:hypothetical protein